MKKKKRSSTIIEALEPRILYSADALGGVLDTAANDDPVNQLLEDAAAAPLNLLQEESVNDDNDALALETTETTRNELVIVDTSTPDYQQIVDDILAQSSNNIQFEIVLLDSQQDGIDQLSNILSTYSDLDAVHLISHGDAGAISLGDDTITLATLQTETDQINNWSTAFSEDGDFLIYGCDLASTLEGEHFINALADMTGADVAASDDLTGSAELGGDWELEYTTGDIETDLAVSTELQQNYESILPNTAPVLSGANDLNAVNEDDTTNGGTLVSSLIASQVSDIDGSDPEGIAIIATDTTNGTWEYTTDGSTWLAVPLNTDFENALLLASDADNAVRFVPNADFNGTVTDGITFVAWDQSSGTDGTIQDLTIQQILLDQYETTSYSNPNDTPASPVNWSTDWIEGGDEGTSTAGDIFLDGTRLNIVARTVNDEISRQADLSTAVSATLSFDFENTLNGGLGSNEKIEVQISSTGGAPYDTLITFDDTNTFIGSTGDIDISNYISATTEVRFIVTGRNILSTDTLFIDNFQISYQEPDLGGTTAFSSASFGSDITVLPLPDAPINTVPGAQNVNEDTALAFAGSISVYDGDGDLASVQLTVNDGFLNVVLSGAASISSGVNGTNTLTISGTQTDINNTLLSLTYQGDPNFYGSDLLSVTSTDGNAVMDFDTVAITVNSVNDSPNAVNDSDTTTEDAAVSGDLSPNDTPSGDGGNTWSLNTGPSNGAATVNADGTFTYTPNADFNGTDSFTYIITDGDGSTNSATVNINVTPVNDSPTALNDAYVTTEDINAVGDLSTNDTSVDNPSTWTLNTGPANGSVIINANGTFTYTPNPNFNGTDSFTYRVTDGDAEFSIATATIVVTAVDDTPTAVGDVDNTPEDTPLAGDVSGNDTASGDGGNVWSLNTDASNGSVTMNANGTYTYTPDQDFNGADSFTYTLTDADGDTSTATVNITVTSVDDTPTAVADSYTTTSNPAITFNGNLGANDTISGDGGNSWSLNSAASNGTAVVNGDGSFTYTPTLNYSGTDSFTYTLIDADGDTSTATVNFTVNNVANAAPINTVPGAQNVNENTSLAIGGISVNDADGDLASVQLTVNDGFLNVTLSGLATISSGFNGTNTLTISGTQTDINNTLLSLTYQGDPNFNGSDLLSVTSTDSNSVTDFSTVAITVNVVNDSPTAVNDGDTTAEDTASSGDLSTNDIASTDGGNTWSLNTGPSNGSATVNADGTYTYTPNENFFGTDSFTYTLADADGDTSTATMSITITTVDDFPGTVDDNFITSEDTIGFAGDLSTNDSPSGDGGNTWTKLADPSNGSVTVNGDGTFSYTPDPDFNGTDSFTYRLTDADGDFSTATANIVITSVDDNSIAIDDNGLNTAEETPLLGDVSTNDTLSADGGNAWSLRTNPTNGSVAMNSNGTYTYTPDQDFDGADSFTYTITDIDGDTSTATVNITVTPSNDPPVNTVPGAQTVYEDTPLLIGGISVNDVDGNLSTVQLTVSNGFLNVTLSGAASISPGANGSSTLTLNGTQTDINATLASLTYQGNLNFNGADSLTVLSTDGNAITDTDAVAITVVAVNSAPTGITVPTNSVNENVDTSAGYNLGTLTNNDPDTGDTFTYTIVGGADTVIGGAAVDLFSLSGDDLILTDGILDFELKPSYEVIVRVTDSGGLAHDEVITIAVNDLNEAPTIVSPLAVNAAEEQLIVTKVTAFDEDTADTLTYTIVGGADAGQFDITNDGLLTFKTPQDYDAPSDVGGNRIYDVDVRVTDGLLTDTQSIAVTLTQANAAPVLAGANDLTGINEDPVTNNGTLVSALISGQLSDIDSGSLEGIAVVGVDNTNGSWEYTLDNTAGPITWVSLASASSSSAILLASDANNAVRFVPDPDWSGTVTNGLTFHAWDQTSGADGATVDTSPSYTLRDNFSTVSYGNNDGTQNWKTNWIEVGDGSGASGGDFRVTGGELRLDGKSNGDYIYREADLLGASVATLSFNYDNTLNDFLLGDKEIRLQVSGNGGSSWTTLDNFNEGNNGSGSRNYDITGFASSNTQVRFVVTNADNQYNYLKIDNFQIAYTATVGGVSAFSSATHSSSIVVTGVNDPAVVSSADVTLAETNIALVTGGTLTSTDVDNPDNTFTPSSFNGLIGNLTIDAAGAWTFTANATNDSLNVGDSLTETYNVTSVDGTASTIKITIDGTNDNPTLTAGSVSATETQLEAGISVDVFTSNLLTGATDIDHTDSSLQIGQVEGSTLNVGNPVAVLLAYTDADGIGRTQNVNLTVNADGSYSIASFDLDAIPTGNNAIATFDYTTIDPGGLQSTVQTATITITGTNDNPTLSAGSIAATEAELEAGYTVNAATSNLLTGAADIDDADSSLVVGQVNGSPANVGIATSVILSYTDADGAAQTQAIDLTVNADGSYDLGAFDLDTLPTGNLATVNFTYTSMDDEGAESAVRTATITITGTNDNPTLSAGSIAATENELEAGYTVNAATSNLLTGAADVDDVDSSLVVGQVNGSPANVGSATSLNLSYIDADGAAQIQAIDLTVNADGSYSLGAFDLDTLPTGSLATVNFTYTSMDDEGAESALQIATITITGTNDNPTLIAGSIAATETELEAGYTVNAATSNLLTGAADADDIDSSLVVGQVNGSPANVGIATSVILSYTDADGAAQTQAIDLTVNADGSYDLGAFDLDALPTGNLATVNFTYTSMDDEGAESTAQIATITITGTNDNPTLIAGSIAATETELEAGYIVNAATSNLLTGAADIDDADNTLVVGQVNGSPANVGIATSVILSYIDADGAAQTQAIDLTVNADGSYSLGAFDLDTLPTGNLATVNFTYTSMDDQGAESTLQVATITITGTNDAPILAGAGSIIATEDQLESGFSVNAATSDLLSLATDLDDPDSSLLIGQVEGLIANVGSAVGVTLTYTDADGAAQFQNVNLTVNADGSYSIAGFDLDAIPSGNNAIATFDYTAIDPGGLQSAVQTAIITISGTNDAPTLTAININSTEDLLETGISAGAGTLLTLAADIDDVDASLVIGQVNGAAGNVNNPITVTLNYIDADSLAQTQDVLLTVNADGSYSISTFDLDTLPLGNNATVTFDYTSMDDQGLESAVQTATITISGTNDAAVVSNAVVTLIETDAPLSTGGTLTSVDIDNVDNTFTPSSTVGTYGNFSINAAGVWTFTANAAFDELALGASYNEVFFITSVDGTASSVDITIDGTNDAAVVSSADVTLIETNAPLSTGGTLTSTDVDNPDNTFTPSTTVGTYGTFNIDAGGVWTFTANAAFDELAIGDSYIELYNLTSIDGTPSTVQITIDGSNDAPVITSSATVNAAENQTATLTVTSTDVDIGDTATYSITGGADSTLLSITSGGVLTFNTSPNFEIPTDFDGNGIYEVQVTANDGKGGTDSQFISITVTNAEDAPIGSIEIDNLVPFEGDTLTASNDIFDEDGLSGPITFQWLRDGNAISGATSNVYNPVQDDVGAILTVVASFTDNLANSYSFTSAPTSVVNTAAGADETGGTPPPEVTEDTGYVSEVEEFDSGINSKTTFDDETVFLDVENDAPGSLSSLLDVVISTPDDDVFGERHEEELSHNVSNDNYNSLPPKFIDLSQLDISKFESEIDSRIPLPSLTVSNAFVEELFKLSRDLEEAFEDEKEQYKLGTEVSVGVAVSLTAGIVSWILRSGSLIASLMSVAPVWRQLDPLPIVGSDTVEKRKERERRDEDENEDDENNTNVENIFDE